MSVNPSPPGRAGRSKSFEDFGFLRFRRLHRQGDARRFTRYLISKMHWLDLSALKENSVSYGNNDLMLTSSFWPALAYPTLTSLCRDIPPHIAKELQGKCDARDMEAGRHTFCLLLGLGKYMVIIIHKSYSDSFRFQVIEPLDTMVLDDYIEHEKKLSFGILLGAEYESLNTVLGKLQALLDHFGLSGPITATPSQFTTEKPDGRIDWNCILASPSEQRKRKVAGTNDVIHVSESESPKAIEEVVCLGESKTSDVSSAEEIVCLGESKTSEVSSADEIICLGESKTPVISSTDEVICMGESKTPTPRNGSRGSSIQIPPFLSPNEVLDAFLKDEEALHAAFGTAKCKCKRNKPYSRGLFRYIIKCARHAVNTSMGDRYHRNKVVDLFRALKKLNATKEKVPYPYNGSNLEISYFPHVDLDDDDDNEVKNALLLDEIGASMKAGRGSFINDSRIAKGTY